MLGFRHGATFLYKSEVTASQRQIIRQFVIVSNVYNVQEDWLIVENVLKLCEIGDLNYSIHVTGLPLALQRILSDMHAPGIFATYEMFQNVHSS